MKKFSFLSLVVALALTAMSLVSCGDDEGSGVGNISLPTPQYESVSGKYELTSAESPYESIELGASGSYIVTRSYGSYRAPSASDGKTYRPMIAGRGTARSTEDGGIIYGTFTSKGVDEYVLDGFGTIKLDSDGGGVTDIEVTVNGTTTTYAVEKAPVMGSDKITNALCRTWKVEKVRDVYLDKTTGEKTDVTVTPDSPGEFGNDMGREVMFSKSGTYLISRLGGTLDMAEWKWKDRSKGTMYYAWDGEWTGDYATIAFEGNRAVVHDKWEDEEGRDESWTYLVSDAATATSATGLAEAE